MLLCKNEGSPLVTDLVDKIWLGLFSIIEDPLLFESKPKGDVRLSNFGVAV
jgi:hypothetical protein